jgi:hypothetical protein
MPRMAPSPTPAQIIYIVGTGLATCACTVGLLLAVRTPGHYVQHGHLTRYLRQDLLAPDTFVGMAL